MKFSCGITYIRPGGVSLKPLDSLLQSTVDGTNLARVSNLQGFFRPWLEGSTLDPSIRSHLITGLKTSAYNAVKYLNRLKKLEEDIPGRPAHSVRPTRRSAY